MRFSSVLTLLVALAAPLAAQPPVPVVDGKVTYRLTVSPAKPPVPLSNVSFLVPYREQWQGNAVQAFLDCFSEQNLFFSGEQEVARDKLAALPLDDPAVKKPPATLRALKDAARYDGADWQLWHQLRRDGVGTLLPNLQPLRRLANVIKVQARGEVARSEILAATRTLRIGFALAQTVRTHPTAIGYLVGVAIGSIATDTVQELQSRPDCPNLYWALAELPRPFFDLRPATQGEITITEQFRPLIDEQLGETALAKLVLKLESFGWSSSDQGDALNNPRLHFSLAAADARKVAAGRKLLLDTGLDKSLVASMSELQVILAADYRQYEIQRDELFAWHGLPYPQMLPGMRAADAAINAKPVKSSLARMLLPSLTRVAEAGARLDQKLAALRLIEALRYHAAETGAFPAKLAECKLPVPADPVTGRDFGYSLAGSVATITVTRPARTSRERTRFMC